MIVSIHQPQYIPWAGYFFKILQSDVFVVYDTVQYPRGKHFGNRNQVKTAGGANWLTVPVLRRSELLPFDRIPVDTSQPWATKHWRTIELAYRRATHFDEVAPALAAAYASLPMTTISAVDVTLLEVCLRLMGAATRVVHASTLAASPERLSGADYILAIIKEVGGTRYISGQGAGSQRYVDPAGFAREGIALHFYDFVSPEYPQLWGGFLPDLSLVDMLLNCGAERSRGLIERAGSLRDA